MKKLTAPCNFLQMFLPIVDSLLHQQLSSNTWGSHKSSSSKSKGISKGSGEFLEYVSSAVHGWDVIIKPEWVTQSHSATLCIFWRAMVSFHQWAQCSLGPAELWFPGMSTSTLEIRALCATGVLASLGSMLCGWLIWKKTLSGFSASLHPA